MIATGAQLDRAGCSLWGAPEKIAGVIIAGGSLVPGLTVSIFSSLCCISRCPKLSFKGGGDRIPPSNVAR